LLIALIGFTGTGKSTLGRTLQAEYGLPCYDSDAMVEARVGETIAEFFSHYGEAAFRQVEHDVIRDVVETAHLGVLVTGGGAVLNAQTRQRLLQNCYTVNVHASLDVIWDRLEHVQDRPLLKAKDPRRKLEELMRERAGVYEIAHASVESGDPSEAASQVMAGWLRFAINGCTV